MSVLEHCGEWYRCGVCKASGVKLWRSGGSNYERAPDQTQLVIKVQVPLRDVRCAKCWSSVVVDGFQDGDLVPVRPNFFGAIPAEKPSRLTVVCWHYSSFPADGIEWWNNLPVEPGRQLGCTGMAATWCPNCGDCSCELDVHGFRVGGAEGCPLHSDTSSHGSVSSA